MLLSRRYREHSLIWLARNFGTRKYLLALFWGKRTDGFGFKYDDIRVARTIAILPLLMFCSRIETSSLPK